MSVIKIPFYFPQLPLPTWIGPFSPRKILVVAPGDASAAAAVAALEAAEPENANGSEGGKGSILAAEGKLDLDTAGNDLLSGDLFLGGGDDDPYARAPSAVTGVGLGSVGAQSAALAVIAAAKTAKKRVVVACVDGSRATSLILGCHVMEVRTASQWCLECQGVEIFTHARGTFSHEAFSQLIISLSCFGWWRSQEYGTSADEAVGLLKARAKHSGCTDRVRQANTFQANLPF